MSARRGFKANTAAAIIRRANNAEIIEKVLELHTENKNPIRRDRLSRLIYQTISINVINNADTELLLIVNQLYFSWNNQQLLINF